MENQTGSLPDLKVRTVVIKASASRIRYEVDHFLHWKGAQIAKCDLDTAAFKNERFAMEECFSFQPDIADGADLKAFFAAVSQDYGGLDAIANNSGIKGTTGKLEQLYVIDWSCCFAICFNRPILVHPSSCPHNKGKWWRLSREYGIGCIKRRLCLSPPTIQQQNLACLVSQKA